MGKTLDLKKKRLEKLDEKNLSVGVRIGGQSTELIFPDEGEAKILCRDCGLEFHPEQERKCPLNPPCRSSRALPK